ncbi:MAG TPA: phosphohydrolase, partial [Bacillus bacterium]|nr:phosphohydrolase [Bacillus sp. (in: firmicutes)]
GYTCWFFFMKNTIQFLMKKNQQVYPDTFHAYNSLVKNSGG